MAKKKKTTVVTTITKETTVTTIPTDERTHIICILDRSASMSGIMQASLDGFNSFLMEQKALPDEATITIALFDDKYEVLHDYVDIKEVEELTKSEWYPRGTTALLDAIAKTVNVDRAKISKLSGKKKPNKVLVCVVTDGYENASKEFKGDAGKREIAKLIKDCENDDWNFIYLAAGQDAYEVGQGFGISAGNTFTYTATMDGVTNMSAKLSDVTTNYRAMNSTGADFGKLSKELLVNDDDDKDIDLAGTITTSNTTV